MSQLSAKRHYSFLDSLKFSQDSDNTLQQAVEIWVNNRIDDSTDKPTNKTVIYVPCWKSCVVSMGLSSVLGDIRHPTHREYKISKVTIETGESTVICISRWLLHQFIIYLNSYMPFKCARMKFGTILSYTGINILVCLSWALSAISFSSHACESYTPVLQTNAALMA